MFFFPGLYQKMGRKPLDLTDEEKKEHTRNRKRLWESNNADSIFQYRRKSVLQCCLRRSSLPTRATVVKYKFTGDELQPIYDKLLDLESTVTQIPCIEPPAVGA